MTLDQLDELSEAAQEVNDETAMSTIAEAIVGVTLRISRGPDFPMPCHYARAILVCQAAWDARQARTERS